MRLVQVSYDPSKKGSAQLTFSLPPAVRAMYSKDAIHVEEWKTLINDFDAKFLNSC